MNISQSMDDGSTEENFVSENVCTSILYESKSSINRCKEVSLIKNHAWPKYGLILSPEMYMYIHVYSY